MSDDVTGGDLSRRLGLEAVRNAGKSGTGRATECRGCSVDDAGVRWWWYPVERWGSKRVGKRDVAESAAVKNGEDIGEVVACGMYEVLVVTDADGHRRDVW